MVSSISDHARPADVQLRKGFGPRVRKLHARIGKAHHKAEGMVFSRALLEGQASPLQLAALLRALAPGYALLEQQGPELASALGARSIPWSALARSTALAHDLAVLSALEATPASAAAAIWLEQLKALARQARTDALTGLLNRRGFSKRLDRQIAACAASGRPGTLVYVDLDNFKAVNDRLGHPAGDAALKGLAAALRGAVRSGDLVARLGGDEFAMWLNDTDQPAAVERARQILALAAEIAPYSAGPDKPLGLSVGVAVHLPGHSENTAELLERADQAMYVVKKHGKGSYSVAPEVEAFRAGKGNSAT